MPSPRPRVALVSPGVRAANNGNWHTAWRWSRFLREHFRVDLSDAWSPGHSSPRCLIALHARRSASSLASYAEAFPGSPGVLVLTGTDLYRDLATDATAQHSLDLASHLVVLQEAALDVLSPRHRKKCRVIYQSALSLAPGTPRKRSFDVVLVGHLRDEKDPLTPMRAIMRLPANSPVRLIHIGAALSDDYARAVHELEAHAWPGVPRYRWLGGRGHAETRRRIRDARAMVISSVIEGGANVIVEAVTSGVPVLASRIPGNVGMLGRDYDGYFDVGDATALAHVLDRISNEAAFLTHLRDQCATRAPLFEPARERFEVNRLVDEVLQARTSA
ncbi:MAG: selenoneine biosynthesis selenosugar synthase SenB [Casimicrobiaceae bacterium]